MQVSTGRSALNPYIAVVIGLLALALYVATTGKTIPRAAAAASASAPTVAAAPMAAAPSIAPSYGTPPALSPQSTFDRTLHPSDLSPATHERMVANYNQHASPAAPAAPTGRRGRGDRE